MTIRFKRRAATAAAVFAMAGAFMLSPGLQARAQTGEFTALAEQLNRLERDLRDIQREVYADRGVGPSQDVFSPSSQAPAESGLSVRLLELERELRLLTGQMEEVDYKLNRMSARFDQFADDVEFRLQALERGAAAAAQPGAGFETPRGEAFGWAQSDAEQQAQADDDRFASRTVEGRLAEPERGAADEARRSPLQGSLAAPESDQASTPEELFESAYALLLRGEYQSAEAAFAAFADRYPDHRQAAEAQHRLGETQFVQGAYPDAARSFLTSVEKYPQGPRAAESLLRLGMSLYELGEAGEACRTYASLPGRYPDASQTVRQRLDVEKSRAGCD